MNKISLQEWLKLSDQTKHNIFEEISKIIGLPPAAVEKDWWVVRTLEIIFNSSIANHTVFKGGTSLSKAWGLIDRFSEDIDLALDRKFLGFEKADSEMTSSQVSKLRRLSSSFIAEKYFPEISEKFIESGLDVKIQLGEIKADDQDPLVIEIYYPSVTDPIGYLQPRILIEIGSRSLMEPFSTKSFVSMVGEHYAGRAFADLHISVPTVNPERTFLEKIFLLHETFQIPNERTKIERKSRHLYDLEKLMDTDFAIEALNNKELYQTIVEHRRKLTTIRGIDYANHTPDKINPIPPDEIIGEWEKDYIAMQQSMLYNPSLQFDKLIARIKTLKDKINEIKH
ncbi:MAG: nucleotidyl transferase AbiEii/AbiGii toxin family protein [Bacteroidota bacterium]|nr:nucleotidyl transferase AbiEii/AbiGii toxin family protein [Bacteroidota bacterium]